MKTLVLSNEHGQLEPAIIALCPGLPNAAAEAIEAQFAAGVARYGQASYMGSNMPWVDDTGVELKAILCDGSVVAGDEIVIVSDVIYGKAP